MRAPLTPLLLGPALALAVLAPASASADPLPVAPAPPAAAAPTGPAPAVGAPAVVVPTAPVSPELAALDAAVRRAGDELTEGTRRLEEGQNALAGVRERAAQTRAEADAATVEAARSKETLGDVVGAAYRSPQPDAFGLALAEGGALSEALRATASLQQVQGRQQDLLLEANTARLRAQSLVAQVDALEAEAAARETELAGEVEALRARAEQARVELEAAAAAEEARRQAEAADAAAAAASAAAALPAGAAPPVIGTVSPTCGGGVLAGYPNGMLPQSALCPLDGTNGLLLRADAAAAYNRMAAAGGMPCAGNSYRPYAQQVSVYAEKPNLAAVPGTSNHGWGVAVDFACGAERFGSPGYLWLKANGPAYGWTHPSWAEPDGSRPEPWHWEYTG